METTRKRILPKVEELLNQRIQFEIISSHKYEAMANWCLCYGFKHASEVYRKYADEERTHMRRLMNYMIDRNGEPKIEIIQGVPNEFLSLLDTIEQAYNHEISITESYKTIGRLILELGDEVTYSELLWFIHEQIEEEAKFNDLLASACRLGLTHESKGTEWFTLEELM